MEERIRKLEHDISRLRTAYDQFFAGVERRPPDILADKVAREVRTLTSTTVTNTAMRFRVQQAISRYNTYLPFWQRKLRDLEEGKEHRRRVTAGNAEEERSMEPKIYEFSVNNSDEKEMEKFFSALAREYQSLGNGRSVDREKLRSAVLRQIRSISDKYGGEKVAFRVVNDSGKVKIKAGPAVRRKL